MMMVVVANITNCGVRNRTCKLTKEGDANNFFETAIAVENEAKQNEGKEDEVLEEATKQDGDVGGGCYGRLDKFKVEVLIRICITMLIGLSLSVASLPSIIPASSSSMPGILSSLALSFPHVQFAILGILPSVFGVVIM
jgi:hypothetical protein